MPAVVIFSAPPMWLACVRSTADVLPTAEMLCPPAPLMMLIGVAPANVAAVMVPALLTIVVPLLTEATRSEPDIDSVMTPFRLITLALAPADAPPPK